MLLTVNINFVPALLYHVATSYAAENSEKCAASIFRKENVHTGKFLFIQSLVLKRTAEGGHSGDWHFV
jgi:hypothetical protein